MSSLPLEDTMTYLVTDDYFGVYEPKLLKSLIIREVIPTKLERIPKVYNEVGFVPAFYRMTADDGVIEPFKKEIREWDVIMPSSGGVDTPRKQPTDIIYKGKKLRNDFPTI